MKIITDVELAKDEEKALKELADEMGLSKGQMYEVVYRIVQKTADNMFVDNPMLTFDTLIGFIKTSPKWAEEVKNESQ